MRSVYLLIYSSKRIRVSNPRSVGPLSKGETIGAHPNCERLVEGSKGLWNAPLVVEVSEGAGMLPWLVIKGP